MPSGPFLWYDGFPTCLHAKIFKKIISQLWMNRFGQKFPQVHKKRCRIWKKIDLSDFILLPSAKKLKLEAKCLFIKVVVAAFLIKSLFF
jgi:hypothetical protein